MCVKRARRTAFDPEAERVDSTPSPLSAATTPPLRKAVANVCQSLASFTTISV